MNPIERAARALCEARGDDPEYLEPGDRPGIDGYRNGEPCHFLWRHHVETVSTVLKAMREPSDVMTTAAGDADYIPSTDEDGETWMVVSWENVWKAMIDAALAEQP